MIKYIKNKMISSVDDILKVKWGGIKKKFQIPAVRIAENKTGKMSKTTASNEMFTSKINATT